MLKIAGSLTDQEQVKTIRVCLTGLADEKNLTVTIPAIKKITLKKRNIVVATSSTVDPITNTAEIIFSCLVSEDTVICSGQRIALEKNATQLEQKSTDGNGRATFVVTEPLTKKEQTILYRVTLPGLVDEVEANVIVPACEASKNDDDPEDLILSRYHNGRGKFQVTVRVLKANGVGIKTNGKIFYRNCYHPFTTDDAGEFLFQVPGCIHEGDDFPLSATVSGIANEATVRIKRREHKPAFHEKNFWLFTTNNGRGLLLCAIMILIWISIICTAWSKSPVISSDMFRSHESGLSSAEILYNQSAEAIDKTMVIKARKIGKPISSGFLFWVIIYSSFSIIYALASWREEIMDGIEDGIEKIVDRNHGRAEDPRLEQWMKHFGISNRIKKTPATVYSVPNPNDPNAPVQPSQNQVDNGGHPSLATLFKMDLLSDALVELVPAILKKIFGK
jgi:hypothetical protein